MQSVSNYKGLKSAQNMQSKNVSTPVIVVAIVVGIVAIGWSAWHFAQPPASVVTNFGSPPAATTARLNELVAKSHGNVGALSPDEQAEANQMTHGNAGMVLSIMYKGSTKK